MSVSRRRASEPSDWDLLHASSDPAPDWPVFMARHQDPVFGYLARQVGARTALELTIEVFAEAYRSRASFVGEPDSSARRWLFGIASNLLRGHYRTEHRRRRPLPLTAELGEDLDAVDDRLAAELGRDDIDAALATLSDDDRQTCLLYAWTDMTYEQIAGHLGIPVGTVRSRLNRVRKRIGPQLAHLHPQAKWEEDDG